MCATVVNALVDVSSIRVHRHWPASDYLRRFIERKSTAAQKLLVAPALKRLELANAVDYMGYMSGQIVGRIKKEQPIREIMEDMKRECRMVLERLGARRAFSRSQCAARAD